MKRKLVSLSVVFFSIFILVNSAFADFDLIYTVDSNGSTVLKDSFGWDAKPWLYLSLPNTGLNVTGAWWQDPADAYYFNGSDPGTDKNIWLSLGNWNDVKKLGQWNINAIYFYASDPSPLGSGSTKFTVTTEPISSILFAVGGVALGIFRKKKSKV